MAQRQRRAEPNWNEPLAFLIAWLPCAAITLHIVYNFKETQLSIKHNKYLLAGSLIWILAVYIFNWGMLVRRWFRRRKQFDVRAQTRDVIFNLEQTGIGTMGRNGDDDVFGRFRRRVKRRSSFYGVTPVILNRVVNGLIFVLWFLAMGPILKRIAVVWLGRLRRG